MEKSFGTKEKIIILTILVVLGLLINTLSPVSFSNSKSANNTLQTQELKKGEASCDNNEDFLSALLNGSEQQNQNSCLFIGCGNFF